MKLILTIMIETSPLSIRRTVNRRRNHFTVPETLVFVLKDVSTQSQSTTLSTARPNKLLQTLSWLSSMFLIVLSHTERNNDNIIGIYCAGLERNHDGESGMDFS
jgi:hypothetical protein